MKTSAVMKIFEQRVTDLLASLLKPIVRFCLKRGIGISQLLDVVKTVMMQEAIAELEEKDSKLTISRLSVMTGIQRRDVKRIMEEGRGYATSSSITTRVIGQWEQDSRFCTKKRKARPLSFEGAGNEFEQLVKSVSKDVGAKAVLFDLKRLELVETSRNKLRLKEVENIYKGPPDEGLKLLARDVDNFTLSVEENLFERQDPRNLHMSTQYDNIFEENIPFIRKWLCEHGQLFHKQARDFLSHYDKDINPAVDKKGGGYVTLVAFSRTDRGRSAEFYPQPEKKEHE